MILGTGYGVNVLLLCGGAGMGTGYWVNGLLLWGGGDCSP